MLYIVDGTVDYVMDGFLNQVYGADDYKVVMAGSHCQVMSVRYRGHYFEGPRLPGIETYSIANDVYNAIKSNDEERKVQPIFLAGHSRGGAAVIRVAQMLQADGIAVEAMFLFDAVDRFTSPGVNAQQVPSNVRAVYHALRDTSLQAKFEASLAAAERDCRSQGKFDPNAYFNNYALRIDLKGDKLRLYNAWLTFYYLDAAMKVRMRGSRSTVNFGNCGLYFSGGTGFNSTFRGSHGAIGGSPLLVSEMGPTPLPEIRNGFEKIVSDDWATARDVWAFMQMGFAATRLDDHDKNKVQPKPAGLFGALLGKWETINYAPIKTLEFTGTKTSPAGWGDALVAAPNADYFNLEWAGASGKGTGIWIPMPNSQDNYCVKLSKAMRPWPTFWMQQPGIVGLNGEPFVAIRRV